MKVQSNKSNPQEPIPAPEPSPQLAEEQLFRAGLQLLRPIAMQLWHGCGRRVELEEVVGIGLVAMVRAVRSYDPSLASFVPYIDQRLRWAMLDGIRRATKHRRRRSTGARRALRGTGERRRCTSDEPAAYCLGELDRPAAAAQAASSGCSSSPLPSCLTSRPVTDSLSLVIDPSSNPEELLCSHRQGSLLRWAVARLPRRERELVQGHYFQDERFDRIAAGLSISKSRACRLHTRALRSLRRDLLWSQEQLPQLVPDQAGSP